MAQRTEDEWLDRFGGEVPAPDGGTIWATYGEALDAVRKVDPNTVWSVIEGENENLYLLPGFHIVNLVGYIVSERPVTADELAAGEWSEVLWMDASEIIRAPGA